MDATSSNETWWRHDPDTERQAFGLLLHKEGNAWIVKRVLGGSPAETADVHGGDLLQRVGEHDVSGFELPTRVASAIEMLDGGQVHPLTFSRKEVEIIKHMKPRLLRDIIEDDVARGGRLLGYCKSCPSCYDRATGARSCGECPTRNCTVG